MINPRPFGDWSENDLARHAMSLEWHMARKRMENLAEGLRKKFEADLEYLQTTCEHPEVSDWMVLMWAPGHLSDYEVKKCNVCDKILWYKSMCHGCKSMMITNSEPDTVWGNFCDECQGKFDGGHDNAKED